MATLAEAQAHQQAVADLTTLAQAELVTAWRSVDLADPEAVAGTLREVLPDLAAVYSLAGATLAADFYESLRDAARIGGSFAASLADTVSPERVQALVGWGTAPLFPPRGGTQPTVEADPDKALSRLSGGLQRVVANADRDTIASNAERDPADATWARHASANACAFCALLATRGAVYASESAALRVGGRGTDVATNVGRTRGRKAKGVRARGTQAIGDRYHDDCRCVAVPEWPDAPLEEAPYVQQWREKYNEAKVTGGKYGAIDLKATLAEMRQTLGTH